MNWLCNGNLPYMYMTSQKCCQDCYQHGCLCSIAVASISLSICLYCDCWVRSLTLVFFTVECEKFENTKGVAKKTYIEKDRKYKTKPNKNKRTNNDLHYTTWKTKDWETWIPLKTGCFFSTTGTCRFTLVTIPMIDHEWRKDHW